MSELHINLLPVEIIIKVLKSLDAVNLKNATLTCKLWKKIIESECRWSLQLLCHKNIAKRKMNFILTTKRKFETIDIKYGRLCADGQLIKMFQKHGFYVVELRLYNVFINKITLAELLNLTPNLKCAEIIMDDIHGNVSDVPQDHPLPDLKRLEYLEIHVNDPRIIECFGKAQPREIAICEKWHPKYYGPFVDFLSSQMMLTSLTIKSYHSRESILVEMGKLRIPIGFQLTKLSISCTNLSYDQDLLKFIESQAVKLKGMEIGFGVPSTVYELGFARMTELKTLSVLVREIPWSDDFCGRLEENRSVRTLILNNCNFYTLGVADSFRNFLKKLPNIRHLVLPYIIDDSICKSSLEVIEQSLSKVESLTLDIFGENDIGYLKFPDLKTLHIKELRVKINWKEFTNNHSQLAELTIERIRRSLLTSDDIDQITTNVDLSMLRLGVGFVADDRFFDIVRTKCINLRVLDLHKSCVPRSVNHNENIKVLRLCDSIESSKYFEMF